jgi:hypothetical protein
MALVRKTGTTGFSDDFRAPCAFVVTNENLSMIQYLCVSIDRLRQKFEREKKKKNIRPAGEMQLRPKPLNTLNNMRSPQEQVSDSSRREHVTKGIPTTRRPVALRESPSLSGAKTRER